MRRSTFILLLVFLSLSVVTCLAQQNFVSKYSTFGAFSYFSTPSLNLTQRGLDTDFGINVRSWLTVGGDFSYGMGNSSLLPSNLNAATQAKLAPFVPTFVKLGIPLVVPYNASTYTYEAGPQFNYRKFKKGDFLRASGARGAAREYPGQAEQPLHRSARRRPFGRKDVAI